MEPRDESNSDPDTNSLKLSALQAFRGHKDSCCVPALQGESQDFFQSAWDRHISHLREATRASVLASIVDIGGSGNSSAARPNSRSATSPAATRHSIIGGIGFNDSSYDAYHGCTPTDIHRKQSEGFVKVDIAPSHPSLRFSIPNKLIQMPIKPRLDPTTEKSVEEDEEENGEPDNNEKASIKK